MQVSADSPEASKPLHGPNQWPEESLLPGLRSVYGQYSEELRLLGMRCEGGGQGDGQGRGHVALVRLCHLPASTPLSTTLHLSGCCGCWPSRWTCPLRTSTRTLSSRCSCSDRCTTRGASVCRRMASSAQVSLGCLEGPAGQGRAGHGRARVSWKGSPSPSCVEGPGGREVRVSGRRPLAEEIKDGAEAAPPAMGGVGAWLLPAVVGNANSRMPGSAKTPVLSSPSVRRPH